MPTSSTKSVAARPPITRKTIYLSQVVDELGEVKAQVATLTEHEAKLKKLLIDSNYGEIDGELFRATVSDSVKTTLDPKQVKKYLTPAQLKRCLKKTPCVTVRVVSRIRS